jgi:DNA-binding transcriptional LysR family regulator
VINLSRVDLNLLVVLEAIIVEGGVSSAALKLNLTQPAVSHALARLRELFGDPLFVRQGRTLVPSALTRRLIEPLQQSLRAVGSLIEHSEGFDPGRSEMTFTVATRDPMEVLLLPGLMKRLATEAPNIDLHTVQVRRRTIEAGLSDGTLDAVLDVPLPLSERIHRQRVGSDRFVVVARKGHPKVRPGFTLPTYLEQQHVMVTARRRGPGPRTSSSASMDCGATCACAAATTSPRSAWLPRRIWCSPCRSVMRACWPAARRCGCLRCRWRSRRSTSISTGTIACTTIPPIAGYAAG